MGRDLGPTEPGDGAIPVAIAPAGGEAGVVEASGLAHMLHQFLQQTLEDSPEKRRLARKLHGEAIFRAAEDETIRVRIRFRGESIELSDAGDGAFLDTASVTADFLSIAHLTAGQESPFTLLARRKLRAHFRPGEIPFLLRMLAFMRSPAAEASRLRLWQAGMVALVLAGVLYILLST